ncbi:FAD-binding oxidoreductase [Roseobacter sp. HKCCA0434]|uniref:NAD(P)/FAD-dependent oxidoreductase n=1 Tax=Roseobacter sp. HKCCA0434 TaxID=3079297 RepID=UPI002905AC8A|nr:FAD-binding oxidoreductase [Roseobacter sp. HKCCA0434]
MSSLWHEMSEEPATARDASPAQVDVGIVGAGYSGLSAALHLAGHGTACHVFEAREIGHGASGRNVGLVNAGLWTPPDAIAAKLGPDVAEGLIDALSAAPDLVFSLIERHQIRCEATREGTLHAATDRSGAADLRRRAADWQARDVPVRLLDQHEMTARTGSDRFCAGLFDPRAGTIAPAAYAHGLARAARAAGATISTHMPVTKLDRCEDGWRITTASGPTRARNVILATDTYGGRLWPALARCQTDLAYFQLASEPLGERAAHVLPGGEGLWTTDKVMVSLRRDRAGRMILGSMGRDLGALTRRWGDRTLARLLPGLGRIRWESAWHGRIGMTPDKLPRILHLAEGLYAPMGYSGRGIGPGTVFGKAIADHIVNGTPPPVPLSRPEPGWWPLVEGPALTAALAAHKLLRAL